MASDLTRPIIGIENRTAQEVFDIMCDRFRMPEAEAEALSRTGAVKVLEAKRITEERLSSLLARIHRDGGHYEAEHGTEKAWADADAIVASIYADTTHPAHSTLALEPAAPEGRQNAVEELAAFLCSEFDFDLDPVTGASWPEHEKDDGYRGNGYVRLQPSDVQARARENAARILTFISQRSTRPSEQAVTDEMVEAAVRAVKYHLYNNGDGKASFIRECDIRAAIRAAIKAAMEAGR
ncbi:MAG: hypothetical protein M9945_12375 [Aquamicrobium sp.]|uniref:hypothetical protein n=1 Tax=Aquamicrobium sp. TaxID=1872579 RepID=UPI00349E591D|nr:hypothetical protein [Aquamicrobium sp.]